MKSNVRIIFDANPLAATRLTGIGQYEKRLIASLAKDNTVTLVGYYYDFLGRKKAKHLPRSHNITYKRIIFYPGALVNMLRRYGIEIPVEFLAKTKGDVALFPNYLSQPSILGAKIVPVVHDVTHELYPQYMSDKNQQDLKKFLPTTLKRSAACIVVSNTTKAEVMKLYDYKKAVTVTPIPFEPRDDEPISPKAQILKQFNIDRDYILFVGTLEPRKNIEALIDAYVGDVKLRSTYALVLCGGSDWKYEEIHKKIDQSIAAGYNIIETGYVSEATRNSLYQHCACFVSASHYEGFGMPALEAMFYNVPVALSDIPIFHEIAGDAAVYFDKDNPQDIANKLRTVLDDTQLTADLIVKGATNLQRFSWHKNAEYVIRSIRALTE